MNAFVKLKFAGCIENTVFEVLFSGTERIFIYLPTTLNNHPLYCINAEGMHFVHGRGIFFYQVSFSLKKS